MRELERELGVPVFERRARGTTLTPMGEAFVRRAGAVLRELERAGEEVKQLQAGTSGRVVAGLSTGAAHRVAAEGPAAVSCTNTLRCSWI